MFRGTPVISAGFQAKISKFCLSKEHSSLRPFSVNVDPMATVCSGLDARSEDHSTFHGNDSTTLYRYRALHGNFNISSAVDASILAQSQMVSPTESDKVDGGRKPLIPYLFRSFMKQCSYNTSEDDPRQYKPYAQNVRINSTSIINGPSVPVFSLRVERTLPSPGEKLWVNPWAWPLYPMLQYFPALIISSICLLSCMHSSVLCPISE
ncbi:hypothetical protein Tco_0005187 [Tanacetum coccineum]